MAVELKSNWIRWADDPPHGPVLGVRTGNAVTGVPRSRARISPAPPPPLVVPQDAERYSWEKSAQEGRSYAPRDGWARLRVFSWGRSSWGGVCRVLCFVAFACR